MFVMQCSSVITILFILFLRFQCDPLTRQENDNRLSTCGTITSGKVWQGRVVEQSEAPWAVFMLYFVGNGDKICTGTVVSSRHIFTATHCFADLNQNGWLDTPGFDRKNCKGKHYVIEDESILKRIRFQSNKAFVAKSPERVTLVNACAPKTVPPKTDPKYVYDDFTVIDLYEELPFSPTLQMACIPRDTSDNALGVELDYFGFGKDPSIPAADSTGVLRHESVKIIKYGVPSSHYFFTKNPDENRIACEGDSGGGTVRKVNGRVTVIGVLAQTSCDNVKTGKDAMELYWTVGLYSKDICQMTGICEASNYDAHHGGYVRKPKPARKLPAGSTGSQGQQRGSPNSQQNIGDSGDSAHSTHSDALVHILTLVFLMIG